MPLFDGSFDMNRCCCVKPLHGTTNYRSRPTETSVSTLFGAESAHLRGEFSTKKSFFSVPEEKSPCHVLPNGIASAGVELPRVQNPLTGLKYYMKIHETGWIKIHGRRIVSPYMDWLPPWEMSSLELLFSKSMCRLILPYLDIFLRRTSE